MSRRSVRWTYTISVVLIALLLAVTGSPVHLCAAIVVGLAAAPLFRRIERASAISALRALDPPQEDAPHNLSSDQVS